MTDERADSRSRSPAGSARVRQRVRVLRRMSALILVGGLFLGRAPGAAPAGSSPSVVGAPAVYQVSLTGVVDPLAARYVTLVARDVPSLLLALEGRTVQTGTAEIALRLHGARVVPVRPSPSERVLHGLVDPNIAFLFFMLGLAGLVFEVIHPGLNLPGVAPLAPWR